MIKSEQNTFTFLEILAFEQNWTCKHKVGHCDLTLLCFFFIFIILNTKVPLMFQSNLLPIISNGSAEKVDLMVLLFLVTAAILDS